MTDDAKKTILLRRAKFVAAALGTVGIVACGGKSESVPPVTSDAAVTDTGTKKDSSPEPCLGISADTGAPEPCLSAPLDSGTTDTAPMPCLDIAPDTGPDTFEPDDAGPAPCLKMPPPDAG